MYRTSSSRLTPTRTRIRTLPNNYKRGDADCCEASRISVLCRNKKGEIRKQKEEKRDNRHERVSIKEKLAEKKDAVIKMNAGKEHSAPEKKKEAVI